jgi:hypothetical protein
MERYTMSATSTHLNAHGVTIDQARSFIMDNMNNVDNIFNVSREYGVTCSMLAEIYGNGATFSDVLNFFGNHGLESNYLIPLSREWLSENSFYEVWKENGQKHLAVHSNFANNQDTVTTDGHAESMTAQPMTMNGYKALNEHSSNGSDYYVYLGDTSADLDAGVASYQHNSFSSANITANMYLFYTQSVAEAFLGTL